MTRRGHAVEPEQIMISNDAMVSVLGAKLDAITARFEKLDAQFTAFAANYTRSDVIELRFKELEGQIQTNRLSILKLERQRTMLQWLYPSVAAVLSSLFTFLIVSYLSSH